MHYTKLQTYFMLMSPDIAYTICILITLKLTATKKPALTFFVQRKVPVKKFRSKLCLR